MVESRVRAAIVVTGTEVLTGRVADANGPWVSERLRDLGVETGTVVVVGDRPDDLTAALRWLAAHHDLVVTTGGLGPTADDLTAAVVADHQDRPMTLDPALESRIRARVDDLARNRGWQVDPEATAAGVRKQALVPEGGHVLEPVGTAPGLVVPSRHGGPPVLVLPGPPGELQAMWDDAVLAPAVRRVVEGGRPLRQSTLRVFGSPESELAALLRRHEDRSPGALDGLEVTTCLNDDGELEIVTRYAPDDGDRYRALVEAVRTGFPDTFFSDGPTVDERLATALLDAGATVATAESCTAGLLAGRLADRPGSSAYLLGGVVSYANEVKRDQLGVPQQLLDTVGAVSAEVARAMAEGARTRLGATYGVGVTGVAGPGGGTPDKPVGLVHVCLTGPDGLALPLALHLGGSRGRIRRRTVVEAMHLLLRALEG